jgi:hypothetical protein
MHDGEIESLFELIKDIMEAKDKTTSKRNPIGFKLPSKAATKTNNKNKPDSKPKGNAIKPNTKAKK